LLLLLLLLLQHKLLLLLLLLLQQVEQTRVDAVTPKLLQATSCNAWQSLWHSQVRKLQTCMKKEGIY
jgi:endonuclease III